MGAVRVAQGVLCLLFGFYASAVDAAQSTTEPAQLKPYVFELTRTTNRNQVWYQANVDADCVFDKRKPVQVLWKMWELEGAPTEGLRFWEKPGYGVSILAQSEREVELVLRGVPDKKMTLIAEQSASGCSVAAWAKRKSGLAQVLGVYLEVTEGGFMPDIHFIRIKVRQEDQELYEFLYP